MKKIRPIFLKRKTKPLCNFLQLAKNFKKYSYNIQVSSKAEFCKEQFLEDLCEKSNDIITAGDFNIDWQLNSNKGKLERILNDNGLTQVMKEFARITNNSKTIICIGKK